MAEFTVIRRLLPIYSTVDEMSLGFDPKDVIGGCRGLRTVDKRKITRLSSCNRNCTTRSVRVFASMSGTGSKSRNVKGKDVEAVVDQEAIYQELLGDSDYESDDLSCFRGLVLDISYRYEDKTEWGDRVGWIYGSVTEDVVTGYRMHNRGWRSIYCLTKRDAFRGSAPINLTDRLHQVLRWATGSVEIFFSRNNAFLASKRLKWLQRLAYLNVGIYPFTSLFLIVYCFLPALSLFSGHFIVKNVNATFLIYLLLMTLCLIGLAVLEVRWSEVSLEDWWRNEQFWLISGTSSHLAAVLQGLLKVIAGIDISFTLTSKAVEEGDDIYAELYLVKWTSLMIPPIVIAMVNVLAMVVAFSRTIYSVAPQWGKFVGGAFFSFWVLAHLYPFFKGLMGRRRKTPTIVFVWSGLIAITLSLLWVAINPSSGTADSAAGGSNFEFP